MTHKDIVNINVLDTDNLLDFDDRIYGDAYLMDQLTNNGHEYIVDCFKNKKYNFSKLL